MRGWDVAHSSFSQIEAGTRILGDIELLMILEVMGADIADLKRPIKVQRKK